MKSPCIAVVTNKPDRLGEHYRDWLAHAGATHLELFFHESYPDLAKRFSRCDALVLTGGGDFASNSKAYANLEEVRVANIYGTNSIRDDIEKNLLSLALEKNKPVLGICRGFQALNVACQGTLIPDISKRLGQLCHPAHTTTPDELAQPGTPDRFHEVNFSLNSSFAPFLDLNQTHFTNSYHHQGIDQLGQGLKITALAPDHIIEEIQLETDPRVIGVQFHPERMRDLSWIQQWTQNWVKQIGQ